MITATTCGGGALMQKCSPPRSPQQQHGQVTATELLHVSETIGLEDPRPALLSHVCLPTPNSCPLLMERCTPAGVPFFSPSNSQVCPFYFSEKVTFSAWGLHTGTRWKNLGMWWLKCTTAFLSSSVHFTQQPCLMSGRARFWVLLVSQLRSPLNLATLVYI